MSAIREQVVQENYKSCLLKLGWFKRSELICLQVMLNKRTFRLDIFGGSDEFSLQQFKLLLKF
jgi:hypothetical protein